MDCVITTILFDGQFWIAVVERIRGQTVHTARHIFGPEPGNAELLDFYLFRLDSLSYISGPHTYRVRNKYSDKELGRMRNKSHAIFKTNQEKALAEGRKLHPAVKKLKAEERYRLKQEKRRNRKRGR